MTPFESLIKEFPIFVVKNKMAVSKNISLKDNEELVVPAYSEVKLNSSLLTSIPSSAYFRPISPSTKDLIRLGVIESKESTPVSAPSEEKSYKGVYKVDDKKK